MTIAAKLRITEILKDIDFGYSVCLSLALGYFFLVIYLA